MKNIWREAFSGIRKRPVLLLPVLLASSLNFCLLHSRTTLIYFILSHQTQHSVMIGEVRSAHTDPASLLLLSGIISAVISFCGVALFVYAMLLVGELATAQRPIERFRHIGSALILILTLVVIAGVFLAATFLVWENIAKHLHRVRPADAFVVSTEALFMLLAAVFVATPRAMKLVASWMSESVSDSQIDRGRTIGYATAVAVSLLSFLQLLVSRSLTGNMEQHVAFSFLGTLIIDLPYAFLFVAFALLALDSTTHISADSHE